MDKSISRFELPTSYDSTVALAICRFVPVDIFSCPFAQAPCWFVRIDDTTGRFVLPSYTRKNLTTCSKSANKPLTSCVRTACYKLSTSLEQVVNNL